MKGVMAFLGNMGIRNIRPALYGWFFNFMFSFVVYVGCYQIFSIPAGATLLDTGNGANISVFAFLADVFQYFKGSTSLFLSVAIGVTTGFFLISVFVSGGIYSVVVDDERTTITNLIANSALNFFSMAKIALSNIVTLLAALVIPVLLFLLVIIFFQVDMAAFEHVAGRIIFWGWTAITALCVACAAVIYDFSRIYRIKDDKNVFYSVKKAVLFVFTHKWSITVLFLLYALTLVLLYLLYFSGMGFVEEKLPAILVFLIYQIFMLTRYYLKIIVIGAENSLVQ